MDRTKNISLESLESVHNYKDYPNTSFTISLDDIYDSISLYEEDYSQNTRRLTWEEWYLKKKIEALKNEKKLHDKMKNKLNEHENEKYSKMSEEEKKKKLVEWLNKKREQKEKMEIKLKKVMEEKEKIKEKKEQDRIKAEENYQKWLDELKRRENAEKEKKAEDERILKKKQEEEKLKKEENLKRMKENKKNLFQVRPNSSKKGVAIVNGKTCNFYDWSTSPAPSYVNKIPWQN